MKFGWLFVFGHLSAGSELGLCLSWLKLNSCNPKPHRATEVNIRRSGLYPSARIPLTLNPKLYTLITLIPQP